MSAQTLATSPAAKPLPVRLAFWLTVACGLMLVRTSGIADTFFLRGDQIRDWRLALGAFGDLPLTGPSSSIGGTGLGPSFYWVLWTIRHLVGPWTENLPHAGGIGVALLQSVADAALALAVWRRFGSWLLALGVVVLGATNPFDLALSATIWNPPVAVAFVKFTIAIVLGSPSNPSLLRAMSATAMVWMAVHAHSTAVFVAVPVTGAFVTRELWARRWTGAARMAAGIAGVIALLQVPLAINRVLHPAMATSPTLVLDSLTHAVAHPSTLHLAKAFESVTGAFAAIVMMRPDVVFTTLFCVVVLVAAVRARADLALLSVTVAPLVVAVFSFITWTRPFETHWCLSVTPCLMVAVGVAANWRWGRTSGSDFLLVILIVSMSARWERAHQLFRLPEYGPLAAGSREIVHRTHEVRAIHADFALPPDAPPDVIFLMLGGRLSPTAPFVATIRTNGTVSYAQEPDVR